MVISHSLIIIREVLIFNTVNIHRTLGMYFLIFTCNRDDSEQCRNSQAREWPYTALTRDALGSTSASDLKIFLWHFAPLKPLETLGPWGMYFPICPPLGSVRVHCYRSSNILNFLTSTQHSDCQLKSISLGNANNLGSLGYRGLFSKLFKIPTSTADLCSGPKLHGRRRTSQCK